MQLPEKRRRRHRRRRCCRRQLIAQESRGVESVRCTAALGIEKLGEIYSVGVSMPADAAVLSRVWS